MKKRKPFIHLIRILISILVLSFIASCKKDAPPDPYLGYNYFPIKTGQWMIYNIDSIAYNEFTQTVDTFRYELKEKTGSKFTDNAGRESYRIERYFRPSENAKWKLKDIWVASLTEARAEKVEENVKFVKLIFPVRKAQTWDGNAYNNMEKWDYQYTETHASMKINNVSFDSTLTVQQIQSFNLIETKNYKEVYAVNAGLVKKEIVDIQTEVNGAIKSGFKFYQTIHSYGE